MLVCVEWPLCTDSAFPLYCFLPISKLIFLITPSIQFKEFPTHFLHLFLSVTNLAATGTLASSSCLWIIAAAFWFSSVVQVLYQMTNDCDSKAILHKRVCLSVIIGETVMLLGTRCVYRGLRASITEVRLYRSYQINYYVAIRFQNNSLSLVVF
jgi:hypothetical protein